MSRYEERIGIHAHNSTKAEPAPISRIAGVSNENAPPRAAAPIPEAGTLKAVFTSAFASCPQPVHSNCDGDPGPVVEHSLDLGPPCTRNGAVQPGFGFDVGAGVFHGAGSTGGHALRIEFLQPRGRVLLATALVSRCRQVLPMFRILRWAGLPDSQLGPVAAVGDLLQAGLLALCPLESGVLHLGLRLAGVSRIAIAVDHRHLSTVGFMAATMSGSGPGGRSTL